MPIHKTIGNRGLDFITYVLLGIYVSDRLSGLRALNIKTLEAIEFHSDDYAFCSDVIWRIGPTSGSGPVLCQVYV